LTPEIQEVADKTLNSLERVLKEYLRG
jgi:hypothetical protein